MTTRVLPPAEWSKLAETDFAPLVPQLIADAVTVLVAEDETGAVIGCWGLITFAHVEGLWVAPAHRKRGRVLVRLWNAMRDLAGSRHIGAVFTGAVTDDIRRLLESRGAQALPPQYVLPLAPLKG